MGKACLQLKSTSAAEDHGQERGPELTEQLTGAYTSPHRRECAAVLSCAATFLVPHPHLMVAPLPTYNSSVSHWPL